MNLKKQWFEVVPNDSCISRMEVRLFTDGTIAECTFEGGCYGNLKWIAQCIQGQTFQSAIQTVEDELCGNARKPCVYLLKDRLKNWFKVFQKQIDEGIVE